MRVAIGHERLSALVSTERAGKATLIIFIDGAVDTVASRSRRSINDSAAGAAAFRGRHTRLDFELRDRIRRRIDSNLRELAFVVVDTIERKIIAGRTRTIYHQDGTARFTKARTLGRISYGTSTLKAAAASKYTNNWPRDAG